jgi:hypothetical protein
VEYFDSTTGNQDPYVWNEAFLHSYCHITRFHAEAGDINLWVSGDRFPQFSRLYCDLVFTVARKCLWTDANDLHRDDPLVDSDEAWADHYRWYCQHPLSRRSRYTLKADPGRSFQPQAADGGLIDIAPVLLEQGINLSDLQAGMNAGIGSQPIMIPIAAATAIEQTLRHAPVILTGAELQKLRKDNPRPCICGTRRTRTCERDLPAERGLHALRMLIPKALYRALLGSIQQSTTR